MRSTVLCGGIVSFNPSPSLYWSPRKRLYWNIIFRSGFDMVTPSTISPFAFSSEISTIRTTKGKSEGFSTRKSITARLFRASKAPVRTFMILPCNSRCDPLLALTITATAITIATRAPPKINKSLLFIRVTEEALISQQSAVPVQAGDIIADGFDGRRDRNGQQQSDATPHGAPEHERHGDHQG